MVLMVISRYLHSGYSTPAHPDCAQHLAVVHKETQTSSFETRGGCGSGSSASGALLLRTWDGETRGAL